MLPQKTQQVCWMGYGEEDDSTLLEIIYEYNREKIDRGDGYGQVSSYVVGTTDNAVCSVHRAMHTSTVQ